MMKADYGTYSNTWLIVGPLGGAAVLGTLAFLPVPPWARVILAVLAVLLALAGAYMTCALANDDLKKAIRDIVLAKLPWDGQGKANEGSLRRLG